MSDTPKTDAAESDACNKLGVIDVVDIEFARAQERTIAELVEALKGVVRVADRKTDEFDAARAAIQRATRP